VTKNDNMLVIVGTRTDIKKPSGIDQNQTDCSNSVTESWWFRVQRQGWKTRNREVS